MENVHHFDKLDWADYENRIPDHTKGSLERYINRGIAPGGFLLSVLSNDLKGACARADIENRNALFSIFSWLHNYAPSGCWGSKERVSDWIEYKRDKLDAGLAEGIRFINEDHI